MQKTPQQRKLTINGPVGALETVLETPREQEPNACVVVCHPHPVHGGTMQNKVAYTLARSFVGEGFAAIRFNFRGVGASDGEFDNGDGELEDVLSVVEWARNEYPQLDLWLAGFSFGAAMAINAAARTEPAGIVSVAPAVSRFTASLPEQPSGNWLIVQGDKDELVDIDETIAWVNELDPGPQLAVFPDTDHFFHGKLVELRTAVQAFVSQTRQAT